KIFNAEGKQVYQLNKKNIAERDQLYIPVSGLSRGSYILQINYNGLIRSEQFIKN
ncbi:MAG: T9SS type A sorting domain-containing protein, partial [Bacteroidia bacterium]|nr:T9SS type A sorting domain-containing protein [Bacteroidia bacterium]